MGRRSQRKPRLDPDNARIAIIGGGLAGLSTALALQQQGFAHVHVFERDAYNHFLAARRDGYGMTLTYNPRGNLAKLGILEALAVADCPSRSHYMLQAPEGAVRGYFGNAFTGGQRGVGQRGNLRVPRQKVRQILLEAIQNNDGNSHQVMVHWSHKLCQLSLVSAQHNKHNTSDATTMDDPLVQLFFTNQSTFLADVVIAADGWNSAVLKHCLPSTSSPSSSPPRIQSLGVYIIVGLAVNVQHPLVNECGFYTLGPRQRLFVMPFENDFGANLDRDGKDDDDDAAPTLSSSSSSPPPPSESIITMWQLSFVTPQPHVGHNPRDPTDATSYVRTDTTDYWQQAYAICQNWHAPVPQLLHSTPTESVWGTLLYDVDSVLTAKYLQQSPFASRIIPVGDALHAMSPFKGQGANQAIQDGAVVAQRLSAQSTSRAAAVKTTLQEIVQRAAPVVQASRQAAAYWHDPARWTMSQGASVEHEHSLAGLTHLPNLVESLYHAGVTASATAGKLDAAIQKHVQSEYGENYSCIQKLPLSTLDATPNTPGNSLCDQYGLTPLVVLEKARQGNLEQLRQWTWDLHARLVQSVVDNEGNTCLHAAVQGALEKERDTSKQHLHACYLHCIKWLVTQAGCSLQQINAAGQTPMDLLFDHMAYSNTSRLGKMLERLQQWEDAIRTFD